MGPEELERNQTQAHSPFNCIRKHTQKLTTPHQGLPAGEEGGEAMDSNQEISKDSIQEA